MVNRKESAFRIPEVVENTMKRVANTGPLPEKNTEATLRVSLCSLW
jgi:hypothetical protein